MRSLRLRIALLLVISIVTVCSIATGVAIFVIGESDPYRMVGPISGQIAKLDEVYTTQADGTTTADARDLGPPRPDLTQRFRERLAERGNDVPVEVFDGVDGGQPVVVAQIGDREFHLDFPPPQPPPPEFWGLLTRWLGLVVVGAIGIALFMAQRMTQPFAIMEKAITSVGVDGVLPHIPEEGTGEMRQTAATLNRLSNRLKSAMESRMRLVAAAGHDLRTPMTRMRIRAEFLNEDDRESWLRDLDELELIADSAIQLVREEVSAGAGEKVRLDTMVSQCVGDLREQDFAVTLGPIEPATVLIGQWAMQRALRNILINAATHGHGGTVRLEAVEGKARITVTDQGSGIPEDLIDKVFEPFFRAEPGRIQTVPGAGLGLAIANEIVQRFSGRIHICNGPTGGLVQVIELPLAE